MSVKDHQRTLPLDVADDICDAVLWRYFHEHVHMIWAQLSFDDIDAFSLAKQSYDSTDVASDVSIDDSSSVLWSKDYVVLTIPRGMC